MTALLTHADACDAPMLRGLCVHHVRRHLASCQRTAAWEALRPSLQSLVLDDEEEYLDLE